MKLKKDVREVPEDRPAATPPCKERRKWKPESCRRSLVHCIASSPVEVEDVICKPIHNECGRQCGRAVSMGMLPCILLDSIFVFTVALH